MTDTPKPLMKVSPKDKEILGIKSQEQIQKDLNEQCTNSKDFFCSECNRSVPFYHCVHKAGHVKSWSEK
jgi:hypothetical protein